MHSNFELTRALASERQATLRHAADHHRLQQLARQSRRRRQADPPAAA